PLHPMRSMAKTLTPGIQPREHQKVTPGQAGIATLRASTRARIGGIYRDQEERLNRSGIGQRIREGIGQERPADRRLNRRQAGRGETDRQLKKKLSKRPQAPEYLP